MGRAVRKISLAISATCFMVFFSTIAFCETVNVGVLLHLTGDLAQFGQMQKKSLLIAIKEIQDRCGDGRSVELVFQDTSTEPDKVRSTVEQLISGKRVVMILAGISSIAAWEAASVANSHRIPFMICTASEDKITEQGWEYVFRINPPFSEYRNGLLWFLSEVVRPRTISILRSKGFTGMLSSADMSEYCRMAGYEIVSDHIYQEDTRDFTPMLKEIKEKEPDVISMASYLNDAVSIMRQCKELDIKPLLFVGLGGGFTLPQFGELAADAANHVFSISIWDPSVPYDGAREYYEKYLKKHNTRPDYHGAEAYAAMQVAMCAINRAQSVDPDGLCKALASTDVTTIIGKVKFISYGKKTQQNRVPTCLVQWINNNMKTVWPPGLASYTYTYPFPGWKER